MRCVGNVGLSPGLSEAGSEIYKPGKHLKSASFYVNDKFFRKNIEKIAKIVKMGIFVIASHPHGPVSLA